MSARRTFLLLVAILVLSAPPLPAATAPMVLENAWLKITVDPPSGSFSLVEKDGGLVDVIDEKWDEPTMTLSGSSRLVAQDPYELRVVVPVGENSWHALAPARQEGPNVRLVLSEPAGGEMKWQIRFERGAVAAPAPLADDVAADAPPADLAKQRPATPPAPDIEIPVP